MPNHTPKTICEFCCHTIRCNISPIKCCNCKLAYHKKCAKQISKSTVSHFTTCVGANSNQWVCLPCSSTMFSFSNLDNDAYLQEQNFSNKNCKSFIKTSKTNFCANNLNSIFSQPDMVDEFLLIPD